MFYLLKQEEKRIKTIIITQVTIYNNNETLRYMTSRVFVEFSTYHFILLLILDLLENSRFGLLIPLRQPRTLNPEPLLVSLVSIFICFNTIIARLVSHVS